MPAIYRTFLMPWAPPILGRFGAGLGFGRCRSGHPFAWVFARVAVLAALFQIAVVGGEPAPLQQRLQEALGAPSASATVWGAVVVRGDGSVVFSTNAHRAFIPASNTKLFIAAMALDRLGPEARLATPLRVHRAPDAQGTLHSDLWIVGQGDPTVGGTPRAADEGSRTGTGAPEMTTAWDEAFEPWVAAWQSRGLKRVEGDLVLCDAALRIPDYGPGWDEEDRAEWYGAPVSAFVVHDNTFRVVAPPILVGATAVPFRVEPPLPSLGVEWRVVQGTNATHRIQYGRSTPGGPMVFRGRFAPGTSGWSAELAVANPPQTFGELLKRTLERRGVPVSGSVRVVHGWEGVPAMTWDQRPSEPLSRRLALCLKPSQNLHAQLLLAEVGRYAEQEQAPGASATSARRHDEWGLAQLPSFLAKAGLSNTVVRLEEGSGLSRANRVTPAATAELLRFMGAHPQHQVWKDSLPVGGVDGTLRHRFKTGTAHGKVRAKTGSLRGVHALAGYVTTAQGEDLVFAIYANQSQADPRAKAALDRFVEVLAGFGDRPSGRPSQLPLAPASPAAANRPAR